MIPEGVYVVTSVSTNKTKSFGTPLGTFDYHYLSRRRYAIGIDQQENSDGRFLIATPEKALVDLVYFKNKKLETARDMLIDLIEARRIDEDLLKGLDKKHLNEIRNRYRSLPVNQLIEAMELL
jgi:hypothetical protein